MRRSALILTSFLAYRKSTEAFSIKEIVDFLDKKEISDGDILYGFLCPILGEKLVSPEGMLPIDGMSRPVLVVQNKDGKLQITDEFFEYDIEG